MRTRSARRSFEIVNQLGVAGMGEVYRARDTKPLCALGGLIDENRKCYYKTFGS